MTLTPAQQIALARLQRHGRIRGRARHTAGVMNKLEAAYAESLQLRKLAGALRDYRYEPFKLRLADKTYYSVDFLVIAADDSMELHEVKGRWEDDARVKIKVAAEQFPWFRFLAIQRVNKAWQIEKIPPYDP